MASKHIKHAEEEIKKYGATVDEQAQAAIDETTTQYDERIAAAERQARELEKQTTDDYISAINAIDLQKALDIKDIQETRANMGLSRSGVSATEQTAAVLAAGNRSNAANLQRQKAIDSLTKSLSDYKIQQGDQLRSDILSINKSADKAKADYAANLYEKAYDADAAEVETQRKVNEEALKERRDSLDSAFKYLSDDEKRQYLPLYMQAVDNGLNGTQFLTLVSSEGARLKNQSELKALLDEGQIDKETYDVAIEKAYTPETATAIYERSKEIDGYIDEAKKKLGKQPEEEDVAVTTAVTTWDESHTEQRKPTSSSKTSTTSVTAKTATGSYEKSAVKYIANLLHSKEITSEEAEEIRTAVGISKETFNNALRLIISEETPAEQVQQESEPKKEETTKTKVQQALEKVNDERIIGIEVGSRDWVINTSAWADHYSKKLGLTAKEKEEL